MNPKLTIEIAEKLTKTDLIPHAVEMGIVRNKTEGKAMGVVALRELIIEALTRAISTNVRMTQPSGDITRHTGSTDQIDPRDAEYAAKRIEHYGQPVPGWLDDARKAPEGAVYYREALPEPVREPAVGREPLTGGEEPRRFSSAASDRREERKAMMRRRKKNQRKHRKALARRRHGWANGVAFDSRFTGYADPAPRV